MYRRSHDICEVTEIPVVPEEAEPGDVCKEPEVLAKGMLRFLSYKNRVAEYVSLEDGRVNLFQIGELFDLMPSSVLLNERKLDRDADWYTLYPLIGGMSALHPVLVTGKKKNGRPYHESKVPWIILDLLGWKWKFS